MVETRSGRRLAISVFVAAFMVFFLGRWLAPVDHAAMAAAAPFQAAASAITNTVGDFFSGVFDGPRLRDENQKLQKEIGLLTRENIALQSARKENVLLRRIAKYTDDNASMQLMTARVIGWDDNALSPFIEISKGSRDGVRTGMTILDQNGFFVGTVSDLTANAAKVQLMLNPSSSVGAIDLSTNAKGLVEGVYGGDPTFDKVVVSATVRPGDFIVTSGDWNLYPHPILLGQVQSVSRTNSALFQSADIKPAADFRTIEMVQVVKNWDPNKLAVLEVHR